jgi:cobalt-zinc-cadmium efflux system outer membrane protein
LFLGPVQAAESHRVALPEELTLGAALSLYRERGIDLLLADSAVNSAAADLQIAKEVANPSVSGAGGKSFTCEGSCRWFGPPLWSLTLGDQGALVDSLSGKRGLRVQVAEAGLHAARSLRIDAERSTSAALKQQFVTMLVAQEALRFTRETADASARQLELTERRYQSGAISEADLARVRTAKLEVDQAVNQAETSLQQARAGLAFLLGVRGELPRFRVREDTLLQLLEPPALKDSNPETLLTEAIANRPDLLAQMAQADRAEAAVSLAHRQVFPEISLTAQYTVQGLGANAISPPTVSFGLATSLPIFHQQQGEISKAEADLRAQQLQAEKLRAQVQADVDSAWWGYQGARAQALRMQRGGLLESARRARDLVTIQYEKGAASLLEYLDAQRTYIGVNLEALQDLASYWTAVFKLEQAVGRTFL